MIDVLVKAIRTLPDPQCEVFIGHLGGAMARVASDATAFPQRTAHFAMNVHTRWDDRPRTRPASPGRAISSTRRRRTPPAAST